MLFFYIRHGDPIYEPDSLTPLGERQAEAVAKRLAMYGIDRVYSSTSTRAIQTAKPTCELLKKEMTLLDFTNEKYAAEQLWINDTWIFSDDSCRELFTDNSIKELGYKWYNHPKMREHTFKNGIERVYDESDKFFKTLGYEHIRYTGKYKVIKSNDERIALFAHGGFGLTFLSAVLDIPAPIIYNHFDICHTGMTVIEFNEVNGYTIPKLLTLSSDSHLYKEGLPTNYNNILKF